MSGGNQPADGPSAIKYGWEKFAEHWQTILVALIVGFLAIVILGGIGFVIQRALTSTEECTVRISNGVVNTSDGCGGGPSFFVTLLGSAIFGVLFFLGQCLFSLFIIRATLMIVKGEPLEASKVLTAENIGPYAIGAILVGILTFIGLLFCGVGAILVAFFTVFWGYFIVDKNMSATEAITASFNLVKDNVGTVIIFLLLSWLVTALGALACVVGLIVAWPVVIIGTGYLYKRLQGEPVAA